MCEYVLRWYDFWVNLLAFILGGWYQLHCLGIEGLVSITLSWYWRVRVNYIVLLLEGGVNWPTFIFGYIMPTPSSDCIFTLSA